MMKLTRDFLHVLPVIVFQNKCIQPIRDKMVLKEYSRLVEHLKGIVFAYRILLGSQHRLAGQFVFNFCVLNLLAAVYVCVCVMWCQYR